MSGSSVSQIVYVFARNVKNLWFSSTRLFFRTLLLLSDLAILRTHQSRTATRSRTRSRAGRHRARRRIANAIEARGGIHSINNLQLF
jgi:hypothetical protein